MEEVAQSGVGEGDGVRGDGGVGRVWAGGGTVGVACGSGDVEAGAAPREEGECTEWLQAVRGLRREGQWKQTAMIAVRTNIVPS